MDSVNISGLLSLLQEGNSNLTSDRAALSSFLVSNSKNASENMRVLGSVSDPMYVGESETFIHSFCTYLLPYIHLCCILYSFCGEGALVGSGCKSAAICVSNRRGIHDLHIPRQRYVVYVFRRVKVILAATTLSIYLSKVASSSAGSSLSARLGMGSAVHQAESSDKTFDDVIGIDEAKADLQVRLPFLLDLGYTCTVDSGIYII